MNFVELSHIITSQTVTYKGLPAPHICDFLSRENSRRFYEPGTEFQIDRIDMVGNTGTYLDSPFHRYAQGKDLSEIPLEAIANLPGTVIHIPNPETREIGVEFFRGKSLKGRAVLIHTGWDRHWETETYYEHHPYLTEPAAIFLRHSGVRLVGIDSHNIDDTSGKKRPVHSILLGAEIPIVEHLCNIGRITAREFHFTAAPPRFQGVGTFPVRAFAFW